MMNRRTQNPPALSRHGAQLLTGVIALVVVSVIVVVPALEHIEEKSREQLGSALQTTAEITKKTLDIWIDEKLDEVEMWADIPTLRAAATALTAAPHTRESLLAHPARDGLRSIFATVTRSKKFDGALMIAPDLVILASTSDVEVGSRCEHGDHVDFLQAVFAGRARLGPPVTVGRASEARPHDRAELVLVAAPILDDAGAVVAALAFKLDPATDFSHIAQLGRIGKTGETYFFDNSGRLLSESRFTDQLRDIGLIPADRSEVLSVEVRDPGGNLVEGFSAPPRAEQPLTLMAVSATAGQSGRNLDGYNDYRGVPVVGAWTWNEEMNVGVATEMDVAEALASYRDARRLVLSMMAAMVTFILCLFSWAIHVGRRSERAQASANIELAARNTALEEAMAAIQTISGIVPICAWCGSKIKDDNGVWVRIETYIEERTDAVFSHGMCPACSENWGADRDKAEH